MMAFKKALTLYIAQTIFDNNLRAIKVCVCSPKKLEQLQVHFISRRYAEFTASLRLIITHGGGGTPNKVGNSEGGDGMIIADLSNLHTHVVSLLERFANEQPNIKKKAIFLVNNWDLVLTVLSERKVSGTSSEARNVEELLAQQREIFVEEELKVGFSRMVSFVKMTESQMATGAGLNLDGGLVEGLVRDFGGNWRARIEDINKNILVYFANFKNGVEVLKQVLTQLLLYYTRFQDIIRKGWRKPPSFTKDLVGNREILAEIKRYALNV
tara:strand:- start:675 stop:1481 length:807 start_codon:yes stop_codon:yes gene_type:complete